jgi:hypothetical protein
MLPLLKISQELSLEALSQAEQNSPQQGVAGAFDQHRWGPLQDGRDVHLDL